MADQIQGLATTVREVAQAAEVMDRTAKSGKEALAKATGQMNGHRTRHRGQPRVLSTVSANDPWPSARLCA